MQKFIYCFLLFFVICVILAGSFSVFTLVYCAVISLGAAAVAVFMFKFSFPFDFHPLKLLFYSFTLVKSIYFSAFITLFDFIRSGGKLAAQLEDVPLESKKSHRLLVCHSITLISGLVSVKSKSGSVTVLKFSGGSHEPIHELDVLLKE